MPHSLHEKLKEIKRSFRPYMNGVVSTSMRQKGSDYKINWGVNLSDLRVISQEYEKDEELANALWNENIRECKILATMLMPPEVMNQEKAEAWMNGIHTQEMAELVTFHLFQHIDNSEQLAYNWLESDNPLWKICAYHILSNQLKRMRKMNETFVDAFLEHIQNSLTSDHSGERHAALNCLNHFANIDDSHADKADRLLEKLEADLQ
jgi:3-methyladenine DNA glycosylase AlkD